MKTNEETIHDYLNGEMSGDALAAFETELRASESLRAEVEAQRQMHDGLLSLRGAAMPEGLSGTILRAADEQPSVRRFPLWLAGVAAVLLVSAGLVFMQPQFEPSSNDATLQMSPLPEAVENLKFDGALDDTKRAVAIGAPEQGVNSAHNGKVIVADGGRNRETYEMAHGDPVYNQSSDLLGPHGVDAISTGNNEPQTRFAAVTLDGDEYDGLIAMPSKGERYLAQQSENRFMLPGADPLSTFSIDVDTASYSKIRSMIQGGQRPHPGMVRIEELINYFDYHYPQPTGRDPFSVVTEVATCPWNQDHKLLQVALQGKTLFSAETPALNLVFLIDVSGSMNQSNKLPLLKQAMERMVDRLSPRDRVSIVVYAAGTGLALPATSGGNREAIKAALNRLSAGGSTAGGAGIELAYKVAAENFIENGVNRVILATDGDFNVGISDTDSLKTLIEKKRETGVYFTGLGFGNGNYRDDVLKTLAQHGNGNYYYIDTISEANKALGTDLAGTLVTIAKDVKIQVEFNPNMVSAYRLIGYENRILAARDFNDDTKDAGEIGAGHRVTALYEIVPARAGLAIPGMTEEDREKVAGRTAVEDEDADIDPLRYQRNGAMLPMANSAELATVKLRYKFPDEDESNLIVQPTLDSSRGVLQSSENLQLAASLACFGMVLRNSEFKGDCSLALANEMAQGALARDDYGYRAEYTALLKRAIQIIK